MQSETETALAGILEEDEDLPRSECLEWTQDSMEYCPEQAQKEKMDKIRAKLEEVQDELRTKAKFRREKLNLIWMEDQKKKIEEEDRMRAWRKEQKEKEEGVIKGSSALPRIRKQLEDKEWISYIRRSLKEVEEEKKERIQMARRYSPYQIPAKKTMESEFVEKLVEPQAIVESDAQKSVFQNLFEDLELSESEEEEEEDVKIQEPEHSVPTPSPSTSSRDDNILQILLNYKNSTL